MAASSPCLLTSDEVESLLSLNEFDLAESLMSLPETELELIGRQLMDHQLAATDGWEPWLLSLFGDICTAPFGPRHRRLMDWFEALEPNRPCRPRVDVWPRGGAKSSCAEFGCVRIGIKLTKRFVLYVSDTQDQSDKHVQSISTLLATAGVERDINKYGHSKGWRRDQLRTADGFNVAAIGLDAASRGIKLDQYRPDIILFDDLDNRTDTQKTVEKKIDAITSSILPSGAPNCAVLFIQNLIHEDSIVSQLVDGRAAFLLDREMPCVEPAVIGLKYEPVAQENGPNKYRITAGEATWAGQPIGVCENQINSWGPKTFEREAQHEVKGSTGYFFDTSKLGTIKPELVPPLERICLAWDLAATEGGGDGTAGWLMGRSAVGKYYVIAVIRGQWASERVRFALSMCRDHYRGLYPTLKIRLPQDPGQAGKDQADQMKKASPEATIKAVTGKKSSRATGFSEQVNLGNVFLVEQDLPDMLRKPCGSGKPLLTVIDWQTWHHECRDELRRFKEDETDQVDDRVDAGADCFNDLVVKKQAMIGGCG